MATSNLAMRPTEIEMITAVNAMQRAVDPLYPEISKVQPMRPAEIELLEAVNALRDKFELILGTLDIYGKSVQDGTPTPENPVPITSIETLMIDAGESSVPIDMQGNQLRSLPDGTHDTLTLTYLRPSSRDGWAWYSRELVQRTGVIVGDNLVKYNASNGFFAYQAVAARAPATSCRCSWTDTSESFNSSNMTKECVQFTTPTADMIYVAALADRSLDDFEFDYPLATPVTIQLDPIELPDIDNVASMHITANDDIAVEYDYDYVIRRTIVNG